MATRLKGLRIRELSLVDEPANKGARVSIFKRDPVQQIVKSVIAMANTAAPGTAKSFEQLLSENEAQRRQWEAQEELYPVFDALRESLRSIAADAGMDMTAKAVAIRVSIEQFVAAVTEKLPDVEEELSKAIKQNPAAAGFFNAGKTGDNVQKGDNTMDDKQKVADLEKQVADLTKRLADFEALEKRAKEAEAKVADLTKAADLAKNDEVLTVGGAEVRKSAVGESVFAVMKAQQGEIEKANDKVELAELEKAAAADYGKLPGTNIDKAKVLKAMKKKKPMDDETCKALETMLKAGNEAMKGMMTPTGYAGGNGGDDSAEAKMDKRAVEIAKAKGITKAAAYAEFLNTDEGRALYGESLGQRPKTAA
jgi:hypothetical protein